MQAASLYANIFAFFLLFLACHFLRARALVSVGRLQAASTLDTGPSRIERARIRVRRGVRRAKNGIFTY